MKKLFSVLVFSLLCSNILFATELIVQLNSSRQLEHFLQQTQKIYPDLKFSKTLSKSWNIHLFEIPDQQKEKCIRELSLWEMVEHVQTNRKAKPRQTAPNDPGYAQQWHLSNTGISGGIAGADIDAELAWDIASGASGVTVMGDTIVLAVVDEGIDLQSSDLNLWKNHQEIPNNNIDDDGNGYVDDYNGWNAFASNGVILNNSHGTKVAGTAASIGNNNFGVTGVSWNTQIMPVAIADYSEAEIVQAYSYLFDQRKLYNQTNGAQGAYIVVSNSSFGVDNAFEEEFPLWCSLYDSLGSVGILSVAATVNFSTDVDVVGDIPAQCSSPYLIAVTNTNRRDELASSGYGQKSIDLASPGTAIYTTGINDQFGATTGTSFSAPLVAGAAALLYAAACDSFLLSQSDPTLAVKDALLRGVEWLPDLIGKTKSNGRLNLFQSLQLFLTENCMDCMELNAVKSEITCPGDNDASIEIQVNGGTTPYQFQWGSGFSDSIRFGMKPGNYWLTVSDSQNCQKVFQVDFRDPLPIQMTLTSTPDTNQQALGTASVEVTGGRSPYSYSWSSGDTQSIAKNLVEGWYYLNIEDQNGEGCLALDSVYVENKTILSTAELDNPFTIYPNPAQNLIKIEGAPMLRIQLLDISGQILRDYELNGISQSQVERDKLSAGTYFLLIESVNRQKTIQKIVFY